MTDLHCVSVYFLLLVVIVSVNGLFNLTILHTNDVHARYNDTNSHSGMCTDPDGDCFGGYARLQTTVSRVRQDEPNTILLDAGDQFQGTLWFYHYGGIITSLFMNLLGYDAMALGNHEFDRNIDGLLPFLKNVTFPVLSSNINDALEPEMAELYQKHVILLVGGEKIGIIGYTTKSTPMLSSPGSLKFLDEVDAIRNEVAVLEGQGVNKIIALGHAGFQVDKTIAREVEGIDIVVGGHTNTFLYTGDAPSNENPEGSYPAVVTQENGGTVLVVQDYAYGKYLGYMKVTFDDNGRITEYGGNPILLNASIPKDPNMQFEVDKWGEGITELMSQVIGRTLFHMEGERQICRLQECNMGNIIADAFVHQNLQHADGINDTLVFIALFNSGGIRDSIEKGSITVGHVLNVMPFRNTVDIVSLKGKFIYEALEHSVASYDVNDAPGEFLQVSGLRVTYNLARPPGQRVREVKLKCATCRTPDYVDLDRQTSYGVVLPYFVANGGDGYSMIKDNAVRDHFVGDLDTDVFMEYLKNQSPLYQGVDGRIRFDSSPDCISSAIDNIPHTSIVILLFTITFAVRQNLAY